jgi:dihydrofolate synthase/folylpolyglutamate synthase
MCSKFLNFHQFQAYLEDLGLFRMNPGLERVQNGLKALKLTNSDRVHQPVVGNHQFQPYSRDRRERLSLPRKHISGKSTQVANGYSATGGCTHSFDLPVVHIVGTNGKGSTATFLDFLAREHGLKTGLFTSPHLVCVRERIKINGQLISTDKWLELANIVYMKCSHLNLTYFEFLTLMAALAFESEKVDLAIFEAGLGGTYDATNVFESMLTVFTSIDQDHIHVLGQSLEEIARDKAGSIKKAPVVSSIQKPEVLEVIKQGIKQKKVPFYYMPCFFEHGKKITFNKSPCLQFGPEDLSLKGEFQKINAGTAILAWWVLCQKNNWPFNDKKIKKALKKAFLPGRMQLVHKNPEVLLDAAHNPAALIALKKTLHKMGKLPETIIFTCLKDKQTDKMFDIISSFKARTFVPKLQDNPRSLSREEIKKYLTQNMDYYPTVAGAIDLALAMSRPILICGSIYLLAEVFTIKPDWYR